MSRDYSAMFTFDGECAVCRMAFSYMERPDAHVTRHLADGTAVVEKAFGKPDRVIPTSSLPVKDTADDTQGRGTRGRCPRCGARIQELEDSALEYRRAVDEAADIRVLRIWDARNERLNRAEVDRDRAVAAVTALRVDMRRIENAARMAHQHEIRAYAQGCLDRTAEWEAP